MPHSRACLLTPSVLLLWGSYSVIVPFEVRGQDQPSAAPKAANAPKSGTKSPAGSKASQSARQADDAAEQEVADDAKREEEKERVAAERFQSVLEKNPRRGTALDRVYGYHVERGSLEVWLKQYRDRTAQNGQDGTAWLLIGLIEAHRGQDAAAVKALQEAEKHLPENSLASFYLGQALVLVEQPKAAAEALERAIERKPAAADLLDVFQALGRVYQRTQQNEKALDVWNRLEKLFPDDLRVQEQIAQTLLEEDQFQLALPRFETLAAKTTKDLYRRSQFQIQVAEIKVRLGKNQEALADFEKLLGELNPENWMYRDVRHKIDNVFLRTEDQAGLSTYYIGWLAKHPDDIDAMVRLSRVLAAQDRMKESRDWLEKGLKLAPTRKDLRQAIIDQLVYDHKFADAIKHYELLDQQEPNNPDTIREWGRLILRDFKRPEAERQKAAAVIWKRLVAAKSQDPLVASQVADLFRHAGMKDEAIALYQQAIKLDPNAPQYREYLGEYFHQLKRPTDALATWQQIIAQKNRTAPNLARLAEVLTGFGYVKEGTAALTEAVALAPQDLDLRMRLARTLNRAEKFDDSLQQLAKADELASNPEEAEAVLVLQLQNYQSAETLTAQIERLQKAAQAAAKPQGAKQWYLLARFQEANHQHVGALQSIQRARELDPKSIPLLATSARLEEANNKYQEAAATNRQLALIDRRFRSEYLTRVAKLEARLGRKTEALQAGRDVIASAPGNPDSYEFFAQLCFQLGQNDEGLETLRRAVRVNPSDPKGVLSLATALANQFKTAEAIDLYWRAFERSSTLDDKLDVIARLTELYLQTNHLDRLLERLDRARRSDGQQQRVMTLCLAQAHQSAGDYGTARTELERMLTTDSRDTQLVQQLAKLAELEGDYLEAAKYQAQLVKLAPSREAEKQLARYLAMSGENAQANELIVKLALEEKDPERLLKSIDELLDRQQFDQASLVTERLVQNDPRNWEFAYRHGMALQANHPQEAEKQFQRLLDLNLPEETLGVYEQARRKQPPAKPQATGMPVQIVPLDLRLVRLQTVSPIRARVSGMPQQNPNFMGSGQVLRLQRAPGAAAPAWFPRDYREARIAAYARLLERAQQEGRQIAFVSSVGKAWEQNQKSVRHSLDWFYLTRLLMQSGTESSSNSLQAGKALLKLPDPTVECYLGYLTVMTEAAQVQQMTPDGVGTTFAREYGNLSLTKAELDTLVDAFQRVAQHPEFDVCLIGQGANIPSLVMAQLRHSNRAAEADKLMDSLIAGVKNGSVLMALLNSAATAGRVDETLKLWDAAGTITATSQMPGYTTSMIRDQYLSRLIMAGNARTMQDVLKVLDHRMNAPRPPRVAMTGTNTGNATGAARAMLRRAVMNPATNQQLVINSPIIDGQLDLYGTELLQVVWNRFQAIEQPGELLDHFEAGVNKESSEAIRIRWQVGLAYLRFCNGQFEMAFDKLQQLSDGRPDDIDLKFLIAQMYTMRSQTDAAVNVLDTIKTPDADVAQVRDFWILQSAMLAGNQDRAKRAAETLSAQNLDASMRTQVVAYMQRLGMRVPSAAIAAATPRRPVASRLGNLLSQLQKLKADGNSDQALQIATSILQKTQSNRLVTNSAPAARMNQAQGQELAQARQAAIQVLNESGKLKDMIERVEMQLKNSPNSIQLHQTLAEYYGVAGEKAKAREMSYRLVELNTADPMPRFMMGLQLIGGPEFERGFSMLKSALKQQPNLLVFRGPAEVLNSFQQSKKLKELARLVEDVDLAALGGSDFAVHLINRLVEQDKSVKLAMPLVKRAWLAYPRERANMLAAIRDQVAKEPEIYEFAKQLIFPESDTNKTYPAWFDLTQPGAEGMVQGRLENLLRVALAQDKYKLLEQELSETLKKHPGWQGGRVAQAFLSIRRQQYEAPVRYFETLIDDQQSPLAYGGAWLIGQELAQVPNADALAVRYYERAADNPANANRAFAGTPDYSLVKLYVKTGKPGSARDALLKAAARNLTPAINSQVDADRVVQNRYEIAMFLQKSGFPLDAISLYNSLLHDSRTLQLAQAYGPQYAKEARLRLDSIFQSLTPDDLARALQNIQQATPVVQQGQQFPAIDVLLTLESQSPRRFTITSPLLKVLKAAATVEKVRDDMAASLQQLATNRPHDISVQVMSGLLGVYDSRPEVQLKAAEQVNQWLLNHPLPTTPKAQATVREVEQAQSYIPLWLVARECLGKQPLQEIGKRIADAALLGGRNYGDRYQLVAMLREGGELAWDAGDKGTAETRWTELLELVAKLPQNVSARAAAGMMRGGVAAGQAVPPFVPASPQPAGVAVPANPPAMIIRSGARIPAGTAMGITPGVAFPSVPAMTVSVSLDVSKLAAERELHALSFKAIRQALALNPVNQAQWDAQAAGADPFGSAPARAGRTNPNAAVWRMAQSIDVTNALTELYRLWTEHHAPADEVYAVLLEAVVPSQHPGVVLMLAVGGDARSPYETQDVGHLLIKQAIVAGKTSDLRKKLSARTDSTSGDFFARVLLVKLSFETQDVAAAKSDLAALSALVDRKGIVFAQWNVYSSSLMNSIVIPALESDELALSAKSLLLLAAKGLMNNSRGSYVDRHSRIYVRLAKLEFDRGNAFAGTELLDRFLKDQDEFYKSFVGKYERSVRQRGLLKVARTLADGDQMKAALKRLGEAADMWQYDWNVGVQDTANVVVTLRAIQALPPDERYELLKSWTIPADAGGALRTLDVFQTDDQVPGLLLKDASASVPDQLQTSDGTVSSLLMLVQAAQEAKKLDELSAAVQPLVERRAQHALELRALIVIAQQKSAEAIADLEALNVQARARLQAPVPAVEPPWSDYHVACAALSDANLRALGQQLSRTLIDQNQQVRRPQMLSHLRYRLSVSLMKDFPQAQLAGGPDPGLQWWHAATEETAEQHAAGQVPAWWVAHAGLVSHVCGPDKQALYFRYPLEGTFEFSVDAYSGDLANGNVGFAGLILNGARDGAGIDISPVGLSETLHLPATVPFANNQYNRLTIQVEPDKLRYLVNKTLVYEDTDPGRNSPWLNLCVERSHQTVYRNFQITGQPTIPRQVRLFEGDRLEGWVANFYQERQPPRRMNGRQSHEDAKIIVRRDPNPLNYDWAAQDGILHGRTQPSTPDNQQTQSRLYYHRPLEAGDELTYEFFYEPGTVLVHPALDRMAMLLDPQGVRLHWITDGNFDDAHGLAANNVTDRAEDRRGTGALPLQPGKWNTLGIRIQDSTAAIELNGQLIYETALDAKNSRQFGFYHDRTQTAAQVRNVLLKGKWPEKLSPELLSDLLALRPTQSPTRADRHARHAIVGDAAYQLTVRDVLQQAAKLAPAERYTYLRDWVLPSDDCPTYRAIGDFTPINPPPFSSAAATPGSVPGAEAGQETPANGSAAGSIQMTGGELVSPVYELVAVAGELQRLPELQQYLEKLPAESPADQQARTAVAALVTLALEQWQPAEALLTALQTAQQQLAVDAAAAERWPAILVAWKALRHPATQPAAKALLKQAAEQAVRLSPSVNWSLIARHLHQRAAWLTEQPDLPAARRSGPGLRQWIPVTWANSQRRGAGVPTSDWHFKAGELLHVPGGTEDWLYFQSPLRGNFDVTCEISSGERQDLQLHYGARYVGIASNLKEVDFGRISGLMVSPQVGQPIRSQGNFFAYQLVVRDGTIEVFVDGHKILDRYQSAQFDSWLGIHAPTHSAGTIRNLKITGSPSIPTELDLLANDRIEDAWRGDYYTHNGMRWREERGTLRSPRLPQELAPQQTLLQYHRPIAEDGELEYEYFYEPDVVDVHPAFDRMVLLLKPEGVNVHWVTDLQYDRTGLSPDNVTTEVSRRKGPQTLPLKPRDWNQVKLKVAGDTVTVILNGVEVYERPLEPVNQRTFGLFHYANDTEARVRNVRYRGNWPKSLPVVGDQELSGAAK